MPQRPSIKRLREVFDYNPDTGALTWRISPNNRTPAGGAAGSLLHSGYLQVGLDGHKNLVHRLAWAIHYGRWPKQHIDHINSVRSDNRIANLRDVSRIVNAQNRRSAQSNNKVGLLGVCLHKPTGKYQAQVRLNGRSKYLGLFPTALDAHLAYLATKRELHAGNTL